MSSNSTITGLSINVQTQILSQYLSLTVGFVLLIFGVVGDCLNIFIFLTVDQYKQNACSLYMLAGSFVDLLFLLVGLTTRILNQGFNKDLTLFSPVWCKMRSSLLDILSLCSFTFVCLQSMDIFFATSRSVSMRQRSNIKRARYLSIGFPLVWIAVEIPSFIFLNLIYTNGVPSCVTTNPIYVLYHTYGANFGLTICIPICMISFFAFRIYKHLRSLVGRNHQFLSAPTRQMSRMALYQIGIVLLFQFPFGVVTAYSTATANLPKSQERQLQDKLTLAFFNVYVYGLYSVRNQSHSDRRNMISFQSSLYCYCIASQRFRRQVIDTLKRFRIERRPNRIIPVTFTFRSATQQRNTH